MNRITKKKGWYISYLPPHPIKPPILTDEEWGRLRELFCISEETAIYQDLTKDILVLKGNFEEEFKAVETWEEALSIFNKNKAAKFNFLDIMVARVATKH